VLIHSGTGGVGIAAIRLAQLIGAEVYATAGSETKRQLLRDMGVRHVYDSRTLDFHDHVRRDTDGSGVDVVLNSLSGKAIVQSVKCLAPFGRFIEIGKTDIYGDACLYLKRFGDNLSYHAVDVDRLMAQKPARGAKLFAEVIALFEEQKLPPHPFKAFGVDELPAALDHLAKGLHIGKVVVTMEGRGVTALPPAALGLRPDKFYVVTGGASGLGIELAKWLVEKGARRLSLVSRSGPKTAYDGHWIERLRERGVEVRVDRIDIARADEVAELIADLRRNGGVAGVIHGAAVLQDATIQRMDADLFARAFGPKAMGAWNLHLALGDEPVEFFLMLSSISAVFGLPGQSNYSAANNFLDKLVLQRRLQGLAAQSVELGVMGRYAGMSREGGAVLNVLESQGWRPLSLGQVLAKVERILLEDGTVRMAANLDWQRFRDFFSHLRSDLKFAHLMTDEALNLKGTRSGGDGLKDKVQALVAGEALNFLIGQVKEALARILGTTPDKIDETKSISAIGLDSLMMNQLRNWIQQKLEVNYPLMRMVKGPSLRELCGHILDEFAKTGVAAVSAGDESGVGTDEELELLDGWFIHHKSSAPSAGRMKLFMFHSMGAGASMFGHFLFNPPGDCDVHCIQLPGRENRGAEAIYTELPSLLDDLERAILPRLDGPFAFYGHSFGGIIAFELARRLRRHGLVPRQFFCSATMAPQITLTWKNRDVMRESTISTNSEQKLIGLMSYIDDLSFVEKILPGMRRDMPLLMGYDYRQEAPLDCPILAISAIEDEVTLPEEMAAWKNQTSRAFRQEMVHGDHWFVSRNKDFIAELIAETLEDLEGAEVMTEELV
jgi:surfactin synthase thioesterase subunit/NADPH:quinone reductase-like Zn-dependent oxidoreductase